MTLSRYYNKTRCDIGMCFEKKTDRMKKCMEYEVEGFRMLWIVVDRGS